MSNEILALETVRRRFPRTKRRHLKTIRFMQQLRIQYPGPSHNYLYGHNPTDVIFSWLGSRNREQLEKSCDLHALRPSGSKRKMIKRIWLHWRSSRLKLGKEYYGYGPGFENTRIPSCACGFLKRDYIEGIQKQKEKEKETKRLQRFRSFNPIKRFPRYPAILRFPRD